MRHATHLASVIYTLFLLISGSHECNPSSSSSKSERHSSTSQQSSREPYFPRAAGAVELPPNPTSSWSRTISATAGNHKLRLTVWEVQLPVCRLCSCGGVSIYDGPVISQENLLATLCGPLEEELVLHSSGPTLHLVYSDSGGGGGGDDNFSGELRFRAKYEEVEGSFASVPACGGDLWLLQGEEGTLSSPKSPRLGLECEWTLRAPQGQTVEVYFTETPDTFCEVASVELFDGDSSTALLGGEPVCRSLQGLRRYRSSGETLRLRYKRGKISNSLGHPLDLIAVYRTAQYCGGPVYLKPGEARSLSTPGYPHSAYPLAACEWDVFASGAESSVLVSFLDIGDCNLTFVQLDPVASEDGGGGGVALLSGSREILPSQVSSQGQALRVRMVSRCRSRGSFRALAQDTAPSRISGPSPSGTMENGANMKKVRMKR